MTKTADSERSHPLTVYIAAPLFNEMELARNLPDPVASRRSPAHPRWLRELEHEIFRKPAAVSLYLLIEPLGRRAQAAGIFAR